MTKHILITFLFIALVSASAHALTMEPPKIPDPPPKPPKILDLFHDSKCMQKPEGGPCKGLFKRFYFDTQEKKCKSFFWGGCQGVVPFEDYKECEDTCGIRKDPNDVFK